MTRDELYTALVAEGMFDEARAYIEGNLGDTEVDNLLLQMSEQGHPRYIASIDPVNASGSPEVHMWTLTQNTSGGQIPMNEVQPIQIGYMHVLPAPEQQFATEVRQIENELMWGGRSSPIDSKTTQGTITVRKDMKTEDIVRFTMDENRT